VTPKQGKNCASKVCKLKLRGQVHEQNPTSIGRDRQGSARRRQGQIRRGFFLRVSRLPRVFTPSSGFKGISSLMERIWPVQNDREAALQRECTPPRWSSGENQTLPPLRLPKKVPRPCSRISESFLAPTGACSLHARATLLAPTGPSLRN
jgi:hypothetical protein